MELTFAQIQSFTVGAVNVFEDNIGIHFRRFTERQVDVIFESDPTERNYDTTGIRVDFHTDATAITVQYATSGKYEILVNNRTACFQRLLEAGTLSLDLADGDNRITLVMPSHCEGVIKRIRLDNATYANNHDYPIKLAFYGDSITQGWNSERDSESYAWLTSRYFDAESRIFGIGGTTFIPAFPEDTGFHPDAVMVAMGTNDYGRNKTMVQIQADCAAYLDAVAAANPGSKLFCITPIWRFIGKNEKAAGTLADVRAEIARIAAEHGYTVINGLDMVLHDFTYYADKGTHPNALGFAQFAMSLSKELKKYLF